ncbi:hypothetical protein D3C78_1750400 [compost metagenome]
MDSVHRADIGGHLAHVGGILGEDHDLDLGAHRAGEAVEIVRQEPEAAQDGEADGHGHHDHPAHPAGAGDGGEGFLADETDLAPVPLN